MGYLREEILNGVRLVLLIAPFIYGFYVSEQAAKAYAKVKGVSIEFFNVDPECAELRRLAYNEGLLWGGGALLLGGLIVFLM